MGFQHRRPCLPPDFAVDRGGQRSPVVEDEDRVVVAKTATGNLGLQKHHQLGARRSTPYGTRPALPLRGDQQHVSAVVIEFDVPDAQRQDLCRPQRCESDGGQEGPQHQSVLRLFGGPGQRGEALSISQEKRSVVGNRGHEQAPSGRKQGQQSRRQATRHRAAAEELQYSGEAPVWLTGDRRLCFARHAPRGIPFDMRKAWVSSSRFPQARSRLTCFAAEFQSLPDLMCLPSANQQPAHGSQGFQPPDTHQRLAFDDRDRQNRAGDF